MPVWSPALFFSSTSEEAYVIQDSVMFDGSADYLTLTFNEAGNTAKWTYSVWLKRSAIGSSSEAFFEARADGNNTGALSLNSDSLYFQDYDDGVGTPAWRKQSNAKFRDPTAWMHIVAINDTSSSTAADRQRLYVNGVKLTSFSPDTSSSQGYASAQGINSTNPHYIGFSGSGDYFNGYMAESIFLDGIAPSDASPFGETNDDGIWIPKDPSDTDNIADWGGSNSFWLKFADATNLGFNSRPTAVTAVAETYKIDKSLWLDGSADYLSRTPSSTGTPKTQTFSFWTKANVISGDTAVFGAWPDDSNHSYIDFNGGGTGILRTAVQVSGSNKLDLQSTTVYRDTTAWKHWLFVYDFTNGVSTGRCRVYRNGVRINAFGTATYPATTDTPHWATSGTPETIGAVKPSSPVWFANIYLADFIRLDGYAAEPTDFGGWSATGDWVPIDPTSFVTSNKGTNGFHLDFADPSAPGNDISGNNNDFAANGTIATTQTTTDSPTNTSGDNEGNYITFSQIDKNSNITLAGGNLTVTNTGAASFQGAIATQRIPNSGKHYFEVTLPGTLSNQYIGVVNEANKWDFVTAADGSTSAGFYGFYPVTSTSSKVDNGSSSSYGGSIGNGSVLGFAIDKDNNEMYVSDDGTFLASSNPVTRASPMLSSLPDDLYVAMTAHNSGGHSLIFNFGQTAFAGSIPSGYVRLNTSELAAPTVTDPRKYFATSLWVGTGTEGKATRACFDSTGTAWTPDFAWIKNRSTASTDWVIADVVRGVTKNLFSNNGNIEDTGTRTTGFIEGGAVVGASNFTNKSGDNQVGYFLKAGGAVSAGNNTTGSIATTVSAADHGGFSIATWTGNGSAGATIGHGLSRKPAMGIFKRKSLAQDWAVYHEGSDASAPEDKYLNLNLTDGVGDATWLNDTAPTTSIWTLGTSGYVNTSSETFVGYFFARTPGLIGIGSYIGNGLSDGAMVVVDDGASGFRPAWVLIKRISGTHNWRLWDAARSPFNVVDDYLTPSAGNAEAGPGVGKDLDFIANGFKLRTTDTDMNAVGTYVYLAFAGEPFNLARAR